MIEATGAGRIGLWARDAGYRRIGDVASHGVGPHEIRRLPASETLVVANGGIRTTPGGRDKLNVETMAPNLSYVSPTGDLVQQVAPAPARHRSSIRHLSITPTGLVAFAMQWQGEAADAPALLGLHRPGDAAPVHARAPGAQHAEMRGYAGSVAFFAAGAEVAISSPRGGLVQVFGADGGYRRAIRRTDVCGLAAAGRDLVLTDGLGTFARVAEGRIAGHRKAPRAWDNHIVPL